MCFCAANTAARSPVRPAGVTKVDGWGWLDRFCGVAGTAGMASGTICTVAACHPCAFFTQTKSCRLVLARPSCAPRRHWGLMPDHLGPLRFE